MRILSGFVLCLFCILSFSCSEDESNPVEEQEKSFSVKYTITGSAVVDQLKYLTHSGDTVAVQNISPGWSYTWDEKGKSGERTYIKLLLINKVGKVYYKIMADTKELISDSLSGIFNGSSSVERGTTLPYD